MHHIPRIKFFLVAWMRSKGGVWGKLAFLILFSGLVGGSLYPTYAETPDNLLAGSEAEDFVSQHFILKSVHLNVQDYSVLLINTLELQTVEADAVLSLLTDSRFELSFSVALLRIPLFYYNNRLLPLFTAFMDKFNFCNAKKKRKKKEHRQSLLDAFFNLLLACQNDLEYFKVVFMTQSNMIDRNLDRFWPCFLGGRDGANYALTAFPRAIKYSFEIIPQCFQDGTCKMSFHLFHSIVTHPGPPLISKVVEELVRVRELDLNARFNRDSPDIAYILIKSPHLPIHYFKLILSDRRMNVNRTYAGSFLTQLPSSLPVMSRQLPLFWHAVLHLNFVAVWYLICRLDLRLISILLAFPSFLRIFVLIVLKLIYSLFSKKSSPPPLTEETS